MLQVLQIKKRKASHHVTIYWYTYCFLYFLASCYFYITIFVNKKVKTAKNILNRKVFANSTPIAILLVLQFIDIPTVFYDMSILKPVITFIL